MERQPACWPMKVPSGAPAVVAHGEPCHDRGERLTGLVRAVHVSGGDGPGGEERTLHAASDEPKDHEQRDVRCQRGNSVADQEEYDQAEQQRAPVDPGGEQSDRRRADHHPEGVGGDRVRGDRDRHVQVGREKLDDAVAAELAGADREGAQRQREQSQLRIPDGRLGGGVPPLLSSALAFIRASMHRRLLRGVSARRV
jgi:hypothetical protein